GFRMGKLQGRKRARRRPIKPVNETVLIIGTILIATIGLLAMRKVGNLTAVLDLGRQWTGVITLYYLLMQSVFFALALSVLRYYKTKKTIYLIIGGVVLLAIVSIIGGNVKRHMIAEVAIIFVGARFFLRYKQPSRGLVLAGLVMGTLVLHQVGPVRQYIADGRGNALEAVADGVLTENFAYFNMEESPELTQALVDVYAANQVGKLEGPAELWNSFVHQYIPSFLFGRTFKNSLMVDSNTATTLLNLDRFTRLGATRTGFSDSFRGYSVFGSLFFLGLGFFLGLLYSLALSGRLWAQFYYLVLLNDGLFTLTESTVRFIVALPFIFTLTLPVFFFASLFAKGRKAPGQDPVGQIDPARLPRAPSPVPPSPVPPSIAPEGAI
ncbi:MAG: hypothetical protein JKX69_05800, partial [Rhodobacteraceae bacterium]|nr:hypothetical protein [Paracoccaceae bacterium]